MLRWLLATGQLHFELISGITRSRAVNFQGFHTTIAPRELAGAHKADGARGCGYYALHVFRAADFFGRGHILTGECRGDKILVEIGITHPTHDFEKYSSFGCPHSYHDRCHRLPSVPAAPLRHEEFLQVAEF